MHEIAYALECEEGGVGVLVYVGGTPPPAPEPGTLVLLGSGILGLAGIARRKLRM